MQSQQQQNAAEAAGKQWIFEPTKFRHETWVGYGPMGICWCILNIIFFQSFSYAGDLPVLCNELCRGKMKRPHQMAFYMLPICKNIRIISHQPIALGLVQGIANTTNAFVGTPFLKVPLAQNLPAARS